MWQAGQAVSMMCQTNAVNYRLYLLSTAHRGFVFHITGTTNVRPTLQNAWLTLHCEMHSIMLELKVRTVHKLYMHNCNQTVTDSCEM